MVRNEKLRFDVTRRFRAPPPGCWNSVRTSNGLATLLLFNRSDPQHGVPFACCCAAGPHNLPLVVDVVREACGPAQSSQIDHDAGLKEEGMAEARVGGAQT